VILPAMMFIVSHGTMMFGGAKPVPVNPNNYRNFKRGDIIVSLAGVFVNFLLALAAVLVFILAGLIGRAAPALDSTLGVVQAMMFIGIRLNLLLIAFNLIPIPPLDGSWLLMRFLPLRHIIALQRFRILCMALLLVLMSSPAISNVILVRPLRVTVNACLGLFGVPRPGFAL
jgi:Zn-dependent protease